MTRPRPLLLLSSLAFLAVAVAACATERKPLRGFDKPPPGTIVLDSDPGGTVRMWPVFSLPAELQVFRPLLNGQPAVYQTGLEKFYDYEEWQMQGWTGGWDGSLGGIPPGTYVLDLVDGAGQSWGKSPPLAIPADPPGTSPYDGSFERLTVMFTNYDGQMGTWTIDPATQDGDKTTDEITVTNIADEDVVVERCLIHDDAHASCTTVGTVAPQADLFMVEAVTSPATADHQALFIHLASDASQSYQRDLDLGGSGATAVPCQVERILVHGKRPGGIYSPAGATSFALSSCYGYNSGPY